MCLGTERHESRRSTISCEVSSGRQGDLAKAFYLSLEDESAISDVPSLGQVKACPTTYDEARW